jgi:sugar lactone lactonase YvrE
VVSLAADPFGNVYAAVAAALPGSSQDLVEWSAATSQVSVLVDSLAVSLAGLATDSLGNVYVAALTGGVLKWTPGTTTLSLLIETGVNMPSAIAADASGNLYIVDGGQTLKWTASSKTLATVIADPFGSPTSPATPLLGVALDSAGNVYAVDPGDGAVEKYNISTRQMSTVFSGLTFPAGLAIDPAGNIYVAETAIDLKEWTASSGQVAVVGASSEPAGFSPTGLAATPAGNILIADYGTANVEQYSPATGQITTVVNTGGAVAFGNSLSAMSLDVLGTFYVSDLGQLVVEKGSPSSQTLTTVVSGLTMPVDAQVDPSRNIYIADSGKIRKWSFTTKQLTTLASSGFSGPYGVAPDPTGNLFINDGNRLLEGPNAFVNSQPVFEPVTAGTDSLPAVIPATAPLFTTASDQPWLSITGTANGIVSFSFAANASGAARVAHISVLGVPITVTQVASATTALAISATGGSGQSAAVGTAFATALTATVTGIGGAPVSGASVTFSGPSNGSAAANFSPSATVLTNASGVATVTATADGTIGTYTVTAASPGLSAPASFTLTNTVATGSYSLASSSVIDPPAAGGDSMLILASGTPAAWSAATQTTWLHISTASGTGTSSLMFTIDANSGATRSGTITFTPGSLVLTVTQAGSTYIPAGLVPLVTGITVDDSAAVAVDAQGDLFYNINPYSDEGFVYELPAGASSPMQFLSPTSPPYGLAADSLGDLFMASLDSPGLQKWTAATGQVTTLVASLLGEDVAVDSAGNAYVTDTAADAIVKWTASTGQTSNVATGVTEPARLTVDAAGDIYFSTGANTIQKWTAATQQVTTVLSGLHGPLGVAVDPGGNIYFSDSSSNTIKEWVASTQQQLVLVPSLGVNGVARDSFGNLYLDSYSAIYELPHVLLPGRVSEPNTAGTDTLTPVPAASQLGTLVSDQPWLALTGTAGGGIGIAFTANADSTARVAHISVLGATITVTQAAGQGTPATIAVTGGSAQSATVNTAFAAPLTVVVEDSAGNPLHGVSVTFAGPATGAGATFSPSSTVQTNAQGVASVTAAANGVAGAYTVTASVTAVSSPATFLLANVSVPSYSAAVTTIVEPGTAGVDSVVIRANGTPGPWIAESGANWLHLLPGSITGAGSGTVGFSFDPNPGAARSAAITFYPGALAVTVTQAGPLYLAAGLLEPIAAAATLVATDPAGNIYYAAGSSVFKYTSATGVTSTILTLPNPVMGLAVDSAGNVYGVNQAGNSIVKWSAATQTAATLIVAGLKAPGGLAVDANGNLYICDTGSGSLKFWNAATQQLSPLVSGFLFNTGKPAIDYLGNVYFIQPGNIDGGINGAIEEWLAATQQVVPLITEIDQPTDVAVDATGALYIESDGTLLKWSPANSQMASVLNNYYISSLAVDPFGGLVVADSGQNAVLQLPRAYAGPPVLTEPATGGSDALLPLLPPNIPFTPVSSASWLSITGQANGVVTFSFPRNLGSQAGVAQISLLGVTVSVVELGSEAAATVTENSGSGQTAGVNSAFVAPLSALVSDAAGHPMPGITVTFAGPTSGAGATFSSATAVTNDLGIATVTATANATAGGPYTVTAKVNGVTTPASFGLTNVAASAYSLSPATLIEPNAAGVDSVLLLAAGSPATWTAVSNAAWLHLDNGSTSGSGASRLIFYFDANTGATRTGTVTLNPGPLTFTVTQAGPNYVPGGVISLPNGEESQTLATDAAGNLYLVFFTSVLKMLVSTGQVTSLFTVANSQDYIAVDPAGNVYYADPSTNNVSKWTAATQTAATLFSTGPTSLTSQNLNGLAVDGQGNVYVADSNGLEVWSAANPQLTVLTTATASSIAADSAGNVYLTNGNNSAGIVRVWNPTTRQLTTAVSGGLISPFAAVPDAAGNLYIVDAIGLHFWNAVTQELSVVVSGVFSVVAADGAGNVYASGIEEVVHGFIGPANLSEPSSAGTDTLLPAIPSSAPLGSPASDQTWLKITGTANGVVSFSFTANTAAAPRVAHITAMGVTITVTQAGTGSSPASVAAAAGSGQTTSDGSAFPATLMALVTDSSGNPLSGVSVTFAGPASGAGVSFSPSATVTTNDLGMATVTATANASTGGPYAVTATVATLTPASFTLTNSNPPATVAALGGSGQSTLPGRVFTAPLSAVVKDSGGNPLTGIAVTFSGPTTGAGAIFSPGSTVLTDSAGVATVVAISNTVVGSYSVKAAAGTLSANFALTNSTISPCDVNQDGKFTVTDVQRIVNQALGTAAPANDVNGDGKVNAIDVQLVINAVLQLGCS